MGPMPIGLALGHCWQYSPVDQVMLPSALLPTPDEPLLQLITRSQCYSATETRLCRRLLGADLRSMAHHKAKDI